MHLASLLVAESSLLRVSARQKEEVIRLLIESLAQTRGVDVPLAIKDITSRERKGTTVFSGERNGVAVAHAVTAACKQVLLAIAVIPDGISWNRSDGPRLKVVFVLIAPPQAHGLYLKALSRIGHLCEADKMIDALTQANSVGELIARVSEGEASLGEIVTDDGMPSFCVLGAGHGGTAMAGHLSMLGCKVNLFNRTKARILPVKELGGIDVRGVVSGFAPLKKVTSDPAEAIFGMDILMVVVPAIGHAEIAELIAPHIKDGQVLVLNPGRTGGALEVAQVIRRHNPRVRPFIAEAQTLLYAARVTNPGQVQIFGIKNSVPLATLPAYHIIDVLPMIRKALPQFVPGDNILKTSLDNIGAVFHPAITILNAGRIEDTHGDFEYYVEGVTPAIAAVLEAIDRERVEVANALGIRATTAREWLYLAYDAAGRTLFEAMRANIGYNGIKAPPIIDHRYISEDVPTSLVPIVSIGEMLGVATPAMRSMIFLASAMHGVDYWAEGRTVDRLGIANMSVKEIRFLVAGADSGSSSPPSSSISQTED
ncbi:MAG: PTS transporter subunit EIIA [Acidobacteria bacterium]|nr:PTS transporter subunit EIIA [Acidobacteriota bacterium]